MTVSEMMQLKFNLLRPEEKSVLLLKDNLPIIAVGLRHETIKLHRILRRLKKNYRKLNILLNEEMEINNNGKN